MEIAGVCRKTITNHIKRGNIPAVMSLNRWVIEYEAFMEWVKQNSLNA